jgi:hypothetical protein
VHQQQRSSQHADVGTIATPYLKDTAIELTNSFNVVVVGGDSFTNWCGYSAVAGSMMFSASSLTIAR